jgi:fucose permease
MSDILVNSGPGPSEDTESSAATYPSPPLHVSTFFDFVNLKKPKSMLAMSNKESIPPLALTTVLFFLWGIGYGFLDILNGQFGQITGISTWGTLGLHAAYYGGYLVSPLTIGRFILKRWGFKSTFIAGLFIYACGALIFWPSAVLTSFPPFVISNFIVGCGFGVLETAANPFISLCGPQENAEIRLNLSQGIQATGSILSAVLADKVLFRSVVSAASLVRFQWTYLAIALFDLFLAAAFYYLPVPEATDDDLRELADRRKDDVTARVFGLPVIWVTFGLAAFSQFWYVASQETLVLSFPGYVKAQLPNGSDSLTPFDFLLVGRGLFALGRFVTAILNLLFKPRWILLVSYIGLIVFAVLAKELHGMSGVVIGLILFFFESGVFSITFAISLRGMGRHTKTGGAIMATTVCGGAVYPFFQEIARIHNHGSVPSSYVVLAVGYAISAIFPLYLMLVPQAKKQVDPVLNDYLHRRLTLRGQPSRRKEREANNDESGNGTGSNNSPNYKGDHYSLGGVLSRPRSLMDEPPSTVDFETTRSPSGVSVHDLAYEHDHTESRKI